MLTNLLRIYRLSGSCPICENLCCIACARREGCEMLCKRVGGECEYQEVPEWA